MSTVLRSRVSFGCSLGLVFCVGCAGGDADDPGVTDVAAAAEGNPLPGPAAELFTAAADMIERYRRRPTVADVASAIARRASELLATEEVYFRLGKEVARKWGVKLTQDFVPPTGAGHGWLVGALAALEADGPLPDLPTEYLPQRGADRWRELVELLRKAAADYRATLQPARVSDAEVLDALDALLNAVRDARYEGAWFALSQMQRWWFADPSLAPIAAQAFMRHLEQRPLVDMTLERSVDRLFFEFGDPRGDYYPGALP